MVINLVFFFFNLNYDFARNRKPNGGVLAEWKLTMFEGLEANT